MAEQSNETQCHAQPSVAAMRFHMTYIGSEEHVQQSVELSPSLVKQISDTADGLGVSPVNVIVAWLEEMGQLHL